MKTTSPIVFVLVALIIVSVCIVLTGCDNKTDDAAQVLASDAESAAKNAAGTDTISPTAASVSESGDMITVISPARYDDGFAAQYASSMSRNTDGDAVYSFTAERYSEYTKQHLNALSKDLVKAINDRHKSDPKPYGEYAYINNEKNAIIIGVYSDTYDGAKAKEEAAVAAEYGFKYFQNLHDPVDTIQVLYVEPNDMDNIIGSFSCVAE